LLPLFLYDLIRESMPFLDDRLSQFVSVTVHESPVVPSFTHECSYVIDKEIVKRQKTIACLLHSESGFKKLRSPIVEQPILLSVRCSEYFVQDGES
jgi:hypothetical protein